MSMNQNMFGFEDKEQYIKSVVESMGFQALAPSKGSAAAFAFSAMSELSDAQEEIEHGMQEEARKTINRAKLLLQQIMDVRVG